MKYYLNRTTNEVHAYEADGSQDAFIPEGLELIDESEVVSALEQQESARSSVLTYSEKRRGAYPSLTEQADMAYWDRQNGTTTLDDAITAVKEQYPKGDN